MRILNKRKWLVLSVIIAFVALGAVDTLMKTPLYTATVRLQIDRNVAKVVEGGNVTPVEGLDFEFLQAPNTSCCRAGRSPSALPWASSLETTPTFWSPRASRRS